MVQIRKRFFVNRPGLTWVTSSNNIGKFQSQRAYVNEINESGNTNPCVVDNWIGKEVFTNRCSRDVPICIFEEKSLEVLWNYNRRANLNRYTNTSSDEKKHIFTVYWKWYVHWCTSIILVWFFKPLVFQCPKGKGR